VEVGFQYRLKKGGTDLSEKTEPWADAPFSPRSSAGDYAYELRGLAPNREYEFRAAVRHPLITTYGRERTFRTGR
jgi:alpha-L-fucosidase